MQMALNRPGGLPLAPTRLNGYQGRRRKPWRGLSIQIVFEKAGGGVSGVGGVICSLSLRIVERLWCSSIFKKRRCTPPPHQAGRFKYRTAVYFQLAGTNQTLKAANPWAETPARSLGRSDFEAQS